jgi:hypothetical protein
MVLFEQPHISSMGTAKPSKTKLHNHAFAVISHNYVSTKYQSLKHRGNELIIKTLHILALSLLNTQEFQTPVIMLQEVLDIVNSAADVATSILPTFSLLMDAYSMQPFH